MSPVSSHFPTTDKRIRSLLEEVSVDASQEATLQRSSLWAGIFWMAPRTHSQQRAHNYNTWPKDREKAMIANKLELHIAFLFLIIETNFSLPAFLDINWNLYIAFGILIYVVFMMHYVHDKKWEFDKSNHNNLLKQTPQKKRDSW